MAWCSSINPQEPVITDANASTLAGQWNEVGLCRGYKPRDWSQLSGVSKPFALPTIPRSEWAGLIRAREERGQLLSHVFRRAGGKAHDQQRTNYCWANAVVTAVEVIQVASGQPYRRLSPASVAAPIRGFRNEGGWGSEALDFIAENGIFFEEDWPVNAIDRRHNTPDGREKAKANRVTEWWEIRDFMANQGPRSFDQLMTSLLAGWPVPIGLLWWGHEVCAMDPLVMPDGKFGVRILNSWGNWGDQGYGVLTESKAIPDDAVAPRVAIAS